MYARLPDASCFPYHHAHFFLSFPPPLHGIRPFFSFARQQVLLPRKAFWGIACALALRGGEPYTLEGDEAVKLWVRLALDARCARWRYSAHSGDYGNELAALLGRSGDAGIRESLLKRTITETLLVCPYITGVEGFSFEHRADGATVRFTVKTVYNSFETEAETA